MKLSIVMLAYNHERFIAKALESILMQETSFDYEVIVGEDCSTDETRKVIKSYEQKFEKRLKPIYREKNVGALRNLFDCLEHCTGEYLAFLEGDDYWESPHKLEMQVSYMGTHADCVMCASNWNIVNIDGIILNQGLNIQDLQYFSEEQLDSFELPAQTSTLMIKNIYVSVKNKYLKFLKWYAWIPMDRLMVPILLRYGKIVVLPEITSNYRWYIEEKGNNWSSKHEIAAKSNRLYFYVMTLGLESFSKKTGLSVNCLDKRVELLCEDLHSRVYAKNRINRISVYIQALLMILIEPHRIRLIRKVADKRRALHNGTQNSLISKARQRMVAICLKFKR
ncbi:MAG: glycosyltransferase [Clostridiales bacterium]|nr:glycosyltransferase [Clostridiales bacterium]